MTVTGRFVISFN